MLARDIMTKSVVSVTADTMVPEIAKLIVKHRISGVPVVDEDHHVIGMVTEADLMHRPESETEPHASWWDRLLNSSQDLAESYVKTHGLRACDVMTSPAITVAEETPVNEVARLLEEKHIKRAPVVRDGRLSGIVSRADLLHGLVARNYVSPSEIIVDDPSIREELRRTLAREPWAGLAYAGFDVADGTVRFWGMVESEEQIKALAVAAERTPGVKAVVNQLSKIDTHMYFCE